jgi:hypothetical protein
MSNYKLSIAAIVVAAVAFSMNDAGKTKEFKFKLSFERLPEDEWKRRITNEAGQVDQACIKKTLADITSGWEGQTLVVDEAGEPAPFCPDARDVMYATPGFVDVALAAYMKEVGARTKN